MVSGRQTGWRIQEHLQPIRAQYLLCQPIRTHLHASHRGCCTRGIFMYRLVARAMESSSGDTIRYSTILTRSRNPNNIMARRKFTALSISPLCHNNARVEMFLVLCFLVNDEQVLLSNHPGKNSTQLSFNLLKIDISFPVVDIIPAVHMSL